MDEKKELFERTPLLDAIFKASNDAVFVADAQSGVIIDANCRAAQLLGYPLPELLGLHQTSLHPEDKHEHYRTLFRENIATGKTSFQGVLARRKDGSQVPIEITSQLFSQGEKQYVVGLFRDVSRMRESEDSLAESIARFEFFFNRASDGFALYHPSPAGPPGNFFEVNEATCKMLGYEKHELLQMSPADTVMEEDLCLVPQIMEKLMFMGKVVFSLRIRKKDGDVIWAEIHDHLFTYDGKPTVLSVVRDITERKKTEDKLRVSQEFTENLLNHSPNPILCISSDTTILFVNPALEKLTGYCSDELLGLKAPYPFWRPDKIEQICNDLRNALLTGVNALEEPFRKKNGEDFWVEITSRPVFKDGKLDYYLANWIDITDRKEAERKLHEMQAKLIQSDKMAALGQLVAGVAHEVNNSLNFITGALPSLRRNFDRLKPAVLLKRKTGCVPQENEKQIPQLMEEICFLLDNIQEGAGRAKKIVHDLHAFSDNRYSEFVLTDVHALLDSTLSLLSYQYKNLIEVEKRYGAEQFVVRCAPNYLGQVFMNVLLNGMQAISGNGRISIATDNAGPSIFIRVADTGCGIPMNIQKRIFEPFFTTKDVGQGTGLGLSISYSIIEKLGGEIRVKSAPGEGAEFSIRLPLAE